MEEENTAKNTVISPKFLVWKLCGNGAFPQSFQTKKLGEIKVFCAVKTHKRSKEISRFCCTRHQGNVKKDAYLSLQKFFTNIKLFLRFTSFFFSSLLSFSISYSSIYWSIFIIFSSFDEYDTSVSQAGFEGGEAP